MSKIKEGPSFSRRNHVTGFASLPRPSEGFSVDASFLLCHISKVCHQDRHAQQWEIFHLRKNLFSAMSAMEDPEGEPAVG